MRKHRLALLLALGMVAGLLVTACGVAVGQMGGPSGQSLFGPTIDVLSLPPLSFAPAAEVHAMHGMALRRAVELTLQEQMMMVDPGACERLEHYNPVDDG